jgi:hypothetical protein
MPADRSFPSLTPDVSLDNGGLVRRTADFLSPGNQTLNPLGNHVRTKKTMVDVLCESRHAQIPTVERLNTLQILVNLVSIDCLPFAGSHKLLDRLPVSFIA